MNNKSHSRLTVFARLWPVSVILMLAFCIAVAYAVVDEKGYLAALSTIGICLVSVVLLGQLISAIAVRRWWCVAGTVVGLLLSAVFIVCTIVALAAGQYRPPKGIDDGLIDTTEVAEDYSFPVACEGKEPTTTDLVTAIWSREETGDAYIDMPENWEKQQQGKTIGKGKAFDVDEKNGYFSYDAYYPEDKYRLFIEYRCFCCTGDSNKVVVENTLNYRDGTPVCGQYSGLSFFLYDAATGKMEMLSPYDFNAEIETPDGTEVIVHKLPRQGDTIRCECHTPSGVIEKQLIWNGNGFGTP